VRRADQLLDRYHDIFGEPPEDRHGIGAPFRRWAVDPLCGVAGDDPVSRLEAGHPRTDGRHFARHVRAGDVRVGPSPRRAHCPFKDRTVTKVERYRMHADQSFAGSGLRPRRLSQP
jgi:hypothetical protein